MHEDFHLLWTAIGVHMMLVEAEVDEDVAAVLASLLFRVARLEQRTAFMWSLGALL